MMRIKDNSPVEQKLPSWFSRLENLDVSELQKRGYLVFPPTLSQSEDFNDQFLLKTRNGKSYTTNLMGWLGKGDERVTIHSRFDDGGSDYFLHYILQKVLKINVMDFDVSSTNDQFYDLLIHIFPYYLEKALKKGLYKEYHRQEYNDFNVKGVIDISRHIKDNTPFLGRISYNVREFSYDNPANELIRHTIEFVKKKQINFSEDFRKIVEVTPHYQKNDLLKLLSKRISIKNPYFSEYIPLLQICKIILRQEKQGFGGNSQLINGILIDGAWLWEEYIATILKDYRHPISNESIYQSGNRGQVRPDFYNDNNGIIIDTKYKRLEKGIKREDIFQIISYLHYRNAKKAAVLYPSFKTQYQIEGFLKGFGGEIFRISLAVPKGCSSYGEFKTKMHEEEKILVGIIE